MTAPLFIPAGFNRVNHGKKSALHVQMGEDLDWTNQDQSSHTTTTNNTQHHDDDDDDDDDTSQDHRAAFGSTTTTTIHPKITVLPLGRVSR
jgi:plastocyanin